MANYSKLPGLFFICFSSMFSNITAQQNLWFGTVKTKDKITQGRFEVFSDSIIRTIMYAPYGLRPTAFTQVRHQKNQLSFTWRRNDLVYECLLNRQDSTSYQGNCICDSAQPIELITRQFNNDDAILQGDTLHASLKDIAILDRAIALLNNGVNWNRFDNRVCDSSSYPYRWSLFCALHQGSIDIDSEYRHLRPANQAVRQAINELTSGKKYAHLLQDFNNEAESFTAIAKALTRAKEIIAEKIKLRQ